LRSFANVEVFPSRIIIFNGGYDDKLVQTFITHLWSKSLPFLHVPQISILPAGFDAKAVVFGAASQMGFDISGAISHTDIKTFHGASNIKEIENAQEKKGEEETAIPAEVLTKPESEVPIVKDQSTKEKFGFVKNKDIALSENTRTEEKPSSPAFTINSPYEEESNIKMPVQNEEFIKHSKPFEDDTEKTALRPPQFPKIPQFLLGLFQIPKMPQNKLFIILIPVILLALIGLLAAYIYLLHAKITVLVSPKGIDQNTDIVFSTESDNDFTISSKQKQLQSP